MCNKFYLARKKNYAKWNYKSQAKKMILKMTDLQIKLDEA